MAALVADPSPQNQMRATVTYHQIIEGVLAELGYEVFYTALDSKGILPGLRKGVRKIQQDEARHIAFGTYLAQRLIAEHPDLAQVFEDTMEGLHGRVLESAKRTFVCSSDTLPFGLEVQRFTELTETLYQRRIRAVLKEGPVTV